MFANKMKLILSSAILFILTKTALSIIGIPFLPNNTLGLNSIRTFVNSDKFDFLKENYGNVIPLQEYDFIIVGAGPAGCVIANRLSEVSEWKILLLEAGKGEMLLTDIPMIAPYFYATDYNWGHKMERQDNICLAMDNQTCPWPRGKAVGGTTLINYMIYARGNRREFDSWSRKGNYGWSYNEILPYFVKSENSDLRKPVINSKYHGKEGYLSVQHTPWRTPLVDGFVQGGKELGYEEVDYNGAEQLGVAYVQGTTRRGRRHSAARAFLEPIKARPNLHILSSSYVTRVLINPDTKEAYGVEYVRNKQSFRVRARKEVILSAGTFNSAQLLMLSGVGPANHLTEMGIPVLQNLPVGETLYDHIAFGGLLFVVNDTVGIVVDRIASVSNIIDWTQGRGPLTAIGGVEGLAYIKTKNSQEVEDIADIELIFTPGGVNADGGAAIRRWAGISREFYDENFSSISNRDAWSMVPMLLHPKSKGYMRLQSSDPFVWPKFYGNYYTDPNGEDIETMVEGIKESIKFANTTAMQKFASRIFDVPIPNCRKFGFGSDDYWRCAVRYVTVTLHHQIATCKMGPSTDSQAVVDPELRVYGINRLRIADCSIIPEPLSGHSMAPSYMIGEKASDMIKTTWGGL